MSDSVWIGRRSGTWPMAAFNEKKSAQDWASQADAEQRVRTIQEYTPCGDQAVVSKITTVTYEETPVLQKEYSP